MPLSAVSLTSSFQPTMFTNLNTFGSPSLQANALAFNLLGINTATWNNAFEGVYTLFTSAPAGLAAALASGGSLSQPQAYYYEVTALGYNGATGTVETQGSSSATATTSSGQQTITLTWTVLPGAISYNIYRNTTNNFTVGNGAVLVGNTTNTTFTDNGTASTTSQVPPASAPNNYIEFALYGFTNLVSEVVNPGHLLALIIQPTGTVGSSQATLAPGSANPLTGIFGGTTPTVTLRINGTFIFSGPATGDTGVVVSNTVKTLRVTNGGSAATTVYVGAIVGP